MERVQERLYSASAQAEPIAPSLAERPVEKSRGWEKLKAVPEDMRKEAQFISGPARFFIVAFLFFLLTAGGAAFYLLYGGRSVSSNNVNVAAQGPTTIASGDTVPLLITVENRNPVAIKNATLTIEFPEGTKSADDPSQPYPSYVENLGDIESGGKAQRTVRAAVFGSENQHVTLPIKLEYNTDGSSATFVKNKQFDFTITSSPISIEVQSLNQISAGQPVTVNVTVKSNATTVLDNVGVVAEYPFGFALASADPQPTGTGNALFNLGTFTPGQEKRITVKGTLSGENNDDRIFKFSAGTLSSAQAVSLSTTYTSKDVDIKLTKPFLATTLSINQDTSESPVIEAGVPVTATITWTNTLPNPVTNAKVVVSLTGEALDKSSVSSAGFYRSSDSTITFDTGSNPGLASLQPGDTGQGTFTFRALAPSQVASLRNPAIAVRVSVSGQRLSESSVPETISSTLSRTVKVGTNLSFAARAVHTSGPFPNTGPVPPEADKETTYTIIYTLSNSGSTVAGTKVEAALPSYVRFTGLTNPSDGSITYNDSTNTVTWTVGDMGSGSTKSAAFQVGLTPSLSQVGTSPLLISAQQVTAVDRFTGRQITGSAQSLSTITSTDAGYQSGFGQVK